MFIEAKKLIGLPIAAMDTQSKIADIQKVLVDPTDGSILGFLATTGFLNPPKVIAAVDISDWDPNGLVTPSAENLVDTADVLRIKEAIDQRTDLFGMKAKTKSGKSLGKVDDFLIDTATCHIVKFYLNDLVLKSRVLDVEKVIKIEKKVIIFEDDVQEIQGKTIGAPA